MKKTYLFFIFFILLNGVNAVNLKIFPEEVSFEGFPNQQICKNITIEASEPLTIIIQDKWAVKGYNGRELVKHKLLSQNLNLNLKYSKNKTIEKNDSLEICITAKFVGDYHGVLLSRIQNQSAGVGVWLKLKIKDKPNVMNRITTNVINSNKLGNVPNISFIIIILTIILVLEAIIFIRKKKHS